MIYALYCIQRSVVALKNSLRIAGVVEYGGPLDRTDLPINESPLYQDMVTYRIA